MTSNDVSIPFRNLVFPGFLDIPAPASGLVVFAHGSGSSRFSLRNQYVAQFLQDHGYATLLFDLLTRDEEDIDSMTHHLRFNIPLLSERLVGVTHWVMASPKIKNLPLAFFGASTGAAAALMAATQVPEAITCVISRGGRPDLADDALSRVTSPTLLIVGERDETVLDLNIKAKDAMIKAQTHIEIIRHATHLFEEPGTLERVAMLSAQWLDTYCVQSTDRSKADNAAAQDVRL